MSVLKLRRDMVVADPDPVVEIERPLPLRTIDVTPKTPKAEIIEHEPLEAPVAHEKHHRTFLDRVRLWLFVAGGLAVVGAYPAMMVMDSDVGDRIGASVDRTKWTVAWAGGTSELMEKHYGPLGWARDSASWSPMGRLTGKPAYQSAMAGALGELVTLKADQADAMGKPDTDLTAAARLLSPTATGVQVRAAHDALVNYDRRQRRRGGVADADPARITAELRVIQGWAVASQTEIAGASARQTGPIDPAATAAVYAAKGRAMAAYVAIDALQWPGSREAEAARVTALAAWKEAAQFHPLFIINGSAQGSLMGNHPAAMGFLIARADTATADMIKALGEHSAPAAPLSNIADGLRGPTTASN